jgi:hypothetical protein
LAKDLPKFTNQLLSLIAGIKASKKFSGQTDQVRDSSHLTLILFKRLLEEGYIKQPIIKDLFARNQLKSLEMLNELTVVMHVDEAITEIPNPVLKPKETFTVSSKDLNKEETKMQ